MSHLLFAMTPFEIDIPTETALADAIRMCRDSPSACVLLVWPGAEAAAQSASFAPWAPIFQDAHLVGKLERAVCMGHPIEMEVAGKDAASSLRLYAAPIPVNQPHHYAALIWLAGPVMAEQDVRRAADQALAAKSRFLAAASHDLRQPFQAMRFFYSVLAAHAREPSARRASEMLGRALTSGEQLLGALLDISTLDAGTVQVRKSRFNLGALVEHLASEYSPQMRAKGLTMHVVLRDLTCDSDSMLIERILRNLLANALRYTRQGGVLLGIRRRAGVARVEVWDTGYGIPEDQLSAIFEEFHQLENPQRDRSRGLGLGLAIVRRLSRLLDIPVEVRSRLGRGSVFAIAIPLAAAEPAPPPEDIPRDIAMDVQTVLVVEDDPMVLMGLRMILESWGLHVLPAEDMAQVLECLDQGRPDLILSDLRLKDGLTGFDVVERARDMLRAAIPAIILTGETGRAELEEGRRRNMTFLHKPIQVEPLRREIGRALKA